MKEIFEAISEFCREVEGTMQGAVNKYAAALPIKVKEQIQVINSLNKGQGRGMSPETLDQFMNSTSVELSSNGQVVIELDPDDWLSNALEDGTRPYNMMDTHLRSNYKMSKKGFRYKVIPINVRKGSSKNMRQGKFDDKGKWQPGFTDRSKEMRTKIDKALKKPKWNTVRSSLMPMTGRMQKFSQLSTNDPDLKGLFKVETFRDPLHMASRTTPSNSKMILFRTISDNPKGGIGKWEHPGLIAREIFPRLSNWLDGPGEVLLEKIIENELSKIADLE